MAANVTQSVFDVTSAAGAQFLAMLLGAFLASVGGFFVTWLVDHMERKRQERSIALVCLDLLLSLTVITNLADGARGRGDPYGPFTLRMVRGCLRDLAVYERNRERIADISDPDLRAEIYQCMARMMMAVEGILSESELISPLEDQIAAARANGDNAKAEGLSLSRTERQSRRETSFEFMMETTRELCGPLSLKLRAVTKSQAQNLAAMIASNTAAGWTTPQK